MRRRELLDEEEVPRRLEGILEGLTIEEARHLDRIVEELSLEIATPQEARKRLALKGGDRVAF